MLCDKYITDITWPRGEYKIRKTGNVLFLNFNEIPSVTLYSNASVITNTFRPNTACVSMGYPW